MRFSAILLHLGIIPFAVWAACECEEMTIEEQFCAAYLSVLGTPTEEKVECTQGPGGKHCHLLHYDVTVHHVARKPQNLNIPLYIRVSTMKDPNLCGNPLKIGVKRLIAGAPQITGSNKDVSLWITQCTTNLLLNKTQEQVEELAKIACDSPTLN